MFHIGTLYCILYLIFSDERYLSGVINHFDIRTPICDSYAN